MTIALFAIAMFLPAAAGCRREESAPKHRELVGIADSINEANGEVTMIWYNEKTDTDMKLTGHVTDETEYFINGRAAKLGDIKVKDRVKVIGYVTGEDTDRVYVVTGVEVERDEDWVSTPSSTSNPTTQQ